MGLRAAIQCLLCDLRGVDELIEGRRQVGDVERAVAGEYYVGMVEVGLDSFVDRSRQADVC